MAEGDSPATVVRGSTSLKEPDDMSILTSEIVLSSSFEM